MRIQRMIGLTLHTLGKLWLIVAGTTFAGAVLAAPPVHILPVPYGNAYAFTVAAVSNWQGDPPGANDWNCKPSAEHPYPVVLVTSTILTKAVNWTSISPYLYNQGYCVFALNYGQDPYIFPGINGLGHMSNSVLEVAGFVDQVLAATGAGKVDMLGHSQGGLLVRDFIVNAGGANKVHSVVLLSSPYSLGGGPIFQNSLMNLITILPPFIRASIGDISHVGFLEDVLDPGFWVSLDGDPVNHGFLPQINYTSITSRLDEFYFSGSYTLPNLPNLKAQLVGDACPLDFSTHFVIPYWRTAVALIGNALDPAHPVTPPCVLETPGINL